MKTRAQKNRSTPDHFNWVKISVSLTHKYFVYYVIDYNITNIKHRYYVLMILPENWFLLFNDLFIIIRNIHL